MQSGRSRWVCFTDGAVYSGAALFIFTYTKTLLYSIRDGAESYPHRCHYFSSDRNANRCRHNVTKIFHNSAIKMHVHDSLLREPQKIIHIDPTTRETEQSYALLAKSGASIRYIYRKHYICRRKTALTRSPRINLAAAQICVKKKCSLSRRRERSFRGIVAWSWRFCKMLKKKSS